MNRPVANSWNARRTSGALSGWATPGVRIDDRPYQRPPGQRKACSQTQFSDPAACTDFIRARTSDRPDVALGLQHLQDSTLALSALATQLRRPQVAEPSAILHVHQTLTHLEPRLRALLPSDVRLTLRCEASDDRIAMATEDLERVLINLVQSAVSAMPTGGTVTVSTGNWFRGMPPAPHVALTVADTGCGMAPEVLAQVFTPGFPTGTRSGTGLGLVSVQPCLYRAGGAVDVGSTSEHGTVVTLTWRALSGWRATTAMCGPPQRSATRDVVRARSSAG